MALNDTMTRRTFLGAGAFGAAGSMAEANAQSADSKASNRRLRIGAMAVGEMSFWSYSWGDILSPENPVNKETLGTRVLNMDITHVWDVDYETAARFADSVGARAVRKYDDMVGEVDGVAIGGYYEIPWQRQLARPYLEAGMPMYLSRPFAYSLRDIDEILELAAMNGTPILATDLYEHLYGASTIRGHLTEVGVIQNAHATCLTFDYPALFHTQFMALKIFGDNVRQVAVVTDDPNQSSHLAATYLFDGWEDQPPFVCTQSMNLEGYLYSWDIGGTSGTLSQRLPVFESWRDDLMVHHLPLLVAMQRTFEGTMFESYDAIRRKTEVFLTGFYSALEKNGAPVKVGSVPVDWRGKPSRPDWMDAVSLPR